MADIEVNPNAANYANLSMNVMMIKRTLLIHLIDQAVPRAARRISIHEDILRPTSIPAR